MLSTQFSLLDDGSYFKGSCNRLFPKLPEGHSLRCYHIVGNSVLLLKADSPATRHQLTNNCIHLRTKMGLKGVHVSCRDIIDAMPNNLEYYAANSGPLHHLYLYFVL